MRSVGCSTSLPRPTYPLGVRSRSLVVALAALFLVGDASPGSAEITSLGKYRLGRPAKRLVQKTRLFGCRGSLRASTDRRRKIRKVRFEARGCKLGAVAAAITRSARKRPVRNATGDRLWEGRRASVILTTHGGGAPLVLLVPARRGAHQACWPRDGFAAFWSKFRHTVASGDAKRVAGSFAFPLKGSVPIDNAKSFATRYPEVIDDVDAAAIAKGSVAAECQLEQERYRLLLSSTGAELVADRVRGGWRWTRRDDVSPN